MRSLSFFLALVSLSGCSYFNLPNPFERSADDYSKTEVGVGTGAVLGAGLGAVVGSASGNAGEGVAIGTLAGGAAGGLIGRQLEKNEQAVDQQNEALIRQREMLAVQEREIGDLRTGLDDFPNNRPSISPKVFPASPRARLDVQNTSINSQTVAVSNVNVPFPIGQANLSSKAPKVENFAMVGNQKMVQQEAIKPQSIVKMENQVIVDRGSQEQKVEEIVITKRAKPLDAPVKEAAQITSKEPIVVAKKMELPNMPVVEVEKPKEKPAQDLIVKKEEVKQEVLAKKEEVVNKVEKTASKPAVDLASFNPDDLQSYDANCMQAQEEAARAKKATSDADKLFYYRRALRLCATEPSYHVDIAKVYESIGRLDEARFEYNQALQLDPDNATANKNLAALSR